MKMRKMISLMLSVVLIISAFSALTVSAQASNTIEVTTAEQFMAAIAASPTNNLGGEATHIKLMNNLDINKEVLIENKKNVSIDLNRKTLMAYTIKINMSKLVVANGAIRSDGKQNTIDLKGLTPKDPNTLFSATNTRIYASDPGDPEKLILTTIFSENGRIELNNCYLKCVQYIRISYLVTNEALFCKDTVVVIKDTTADTGGVGLNTWDNHDFLIKLTECVDENSNEIENMGKEVNKFTVGKEYTFNSPDGTINQDDFEIAHAGTTASVTSRIPGPSYIVNIPTTISVNTTRPLSKYENAETDRLGNPINLKERFTVSAKDVKNFFNGNQLKITVGNLNDTFTLKSGDNTIPITLGKKTGETDAEYALGTEFALFNNDYDLAGKTNFQEGYIKFNRAKIPAGGTYTGTLTFNIGIKGAN